MRRRAFAALIASGLLLASPAWSDAAEVRVGVRDAVVFVAAEDEANRVVFSLSPGGGVLVSDAGASLRAGPGCSAVGAAVRCPFAGEVLVRLGDRSDRLVASRLRNAEISAGGGEGADRLIGDGGRTVIDDALRGGAGGDVMVGRGGGDYLFGGTGRDRLAGSAGVDFLYGNGMADWLRGELGADTLSPGPGDDRANGGAGRDRLVEISEGSGEDEMLGGAGPDTALYFCRVCRVSLDNRANDGAAPGGPISGADDVRTENVATPGSYFDQTAEEFVTFQPGEDVLRGHGGANRLVSGLGDDRIFAGLGRDRIKAGNGDDRIDAADGAVDQVACGGGEDRVTADPADNLDGCETVTAASRRVH